MARRPARAASAAVLPRAILASSFSITTASAARASAAHCLQQVVSAGEVAVGGVGNHAGAAGGLAQHHGVGAAIACQLDAGIEQRAAQVAVMVGAAGRHAA